MISSAFIYFSAFNINSTKKTDFFNEQTNHRICPNETKIIRSSVSIRSSCMKYLFVLRLEPNIWVRFSFISFVYVMMMLGQIVWNTHTYKEHKRTFLFRLYFLFHFENIRYYSIKQIQVEIVGEPSFGAINCYPWK